MRLDFFKKHHLYLFLLLPLIVWFILVTTSTDILEVFHFSQWNGDKETRFSINKRDLEKFNNILITSHEDSHFSGFNWLVDDKTFDRDYYLSFEKKNGHSNEDETTESNTQSRENTISAQDAESRRKQPPDFIISTGKDRTNGYFQTPFTLPVSNLPGKKIKPQGMDSGTVTFRIDFYPVPWHLFWWSLGCSLLEILLILITRRITRFDSKRLSPLVTTLAITNFFLAFRLIFAFKAYIHHPFSEKSFFLAKLSLAVAPLALTVLFLLGCLKIFRNLGYQITRKLENKYYHQLVVLAAIAFIVVTFRVVIGTGQEALQLGSRFALSIIFVPATLFLAAAALLFIYSWYYRLKDCTSVSIQGLNSPSVVSDKKHSLISVLLILAVVLVYGLVGLRDKGLILLFLPPFLLVNCIFIFTVKIRSRKRARWFPHLLNLVLMAGFIFLLASPAKFFIMLHNIGQFKFSANLEPRQISDSFNLQRVLSSVDSPLVLKDYSRATWAQMEELDRVKQYMELSRTDKGYTETVIDYSLESRALHDYVTAVFMIPEFGGFWILVTIAVLSIFAVIPIGRLRKERPERRRRFSFLLFMVTGFTLFYSGMYMIGGNLFIFPFSGKNVYLWGLDSGGDIVEAIIILAIFTLGYVYSRFDSATLRQQ